MAAARPNERGFVRRGQIPARSDEKRAAAHRRVDDSELQNAIGLGAADERAERPANDVFRDRLRRVERAGRFARSRSCPELHACAAKATMADLGPVIEQRLVDRPELLDAEIPIRDSLAPRAIGRGPRRQRQHRPSRGFIVEIPALGERRARWSEQTSVERSHSQVAGAAAGMSKSRDRAQRVPETRARRAGVRRRPVGRQGCSCPDRPDATREPAPALRRTAERRCDRRSSAPVRRRRRDVPPLAGVGPVRAPTEHPSTPQARRP